MYNESCNVSLNFLSFLRIQMEKRSDFGEYILEKYSQTLGLSPECHITHMHTLLLLVSNYCHISKRNPHVISR